MAEYKKLIIGLGYSEGRACSWDGRKIYGQNLVQLGSAGCESGADGLFIYDCSVSEADHEAMLHTLRELCRKIDAPVIAGGRVKRLEDVKKYLYAGASAVFLYMGADGNEALIKDASKRFGGEKIYAYLPKLSYTAQAQSLAKLGACGFVIPIAGQTPSLEEMEAFRHCPGICLTASGAADEVKEQAKGLKASLGCPETAGAILALDEDRIGASMEIKQQLKADGIFLDTLQPAFQWRDLKKGADGLVPVIVQDYRNKEVLMLAYMNEEAFEWTLASGKMTYFSRSRQCLWIKGETSGHFQYVKELRIDCDEDTLLAEVEQVGGACHTGNRSCFYRELAKKEYKNRNPLGVFEDVYQVILDRKAHPKEGSYTNYLFDKGIDKILKKVGEECTEIVIAAKNPDPEEIKYEMADFLYHMMVLMAQKDMTWEEITDELANR